MALRQTLFRTPMCLAVKTVVSTPKINTCKSLFFGALLHTVTGFHPYPDHTPYSFSGHLFVDGGHRAALYSL